MQILKRIVYISVVLFYFMGFAQAESNEKNLLQDIKIKILTEDEIKVFLIFSSGNIPTAKVKREGQNLKVVFTTSYADLNTENIEVNHALLKSIALLNLDHNLNLIFKSEPDSYFTLRQKNNIYALTILTKNKLDTLSKTTSSQGKPSAYQFSEKEKIAGVELSAGSPSHGKEEILNDLIGKLDELADVKQVDDKNSAVTNLDRDHSSILNDSAIPIKFYDREEKKATKEISSVASVNNELEKNDKIINDTSKVQKVDQENIKLDGVETREKNKIAFNEDSKLVTIDKSNPKNNKKSAVVNDNKKTTESKTIDNKEQLISSKKQVLNKDEPISSSKKKPISDDMKRFSADKESLALDSKEFQLEQDRSAILTNLINLAGDDSSSDYDKSLENKDKETNLLSKESHLAKKQNSITSQSDISQQAKDIVNKLVDVIDITDVKIAPNAEKNILSQNSDEGNFIHDDSKKESEEQEQLNENAAGSEQESTISLSKNAIDSFEKEKIHKINDNEFQKDKFDNSKTSEVENKEETVTEYITTKKLSNVNNFDFISTDEKTGKILLSLSDNDVDIIADESQMKSNVLRFNFKNTAATPSLEKSRDVSNLATIVNKIKWITDPQSQDVSLEIENKSFADYIVYQQEKKVVIELRKRQLSASNPATTGERYAGKKISLNFQNIDLRSVLQILADFTELNLVASDAVQGNISIRLMDVPWDQALDIILKTKSLDKREFGNILLIAPNSEIFELERTELESQQKIEKLAKLETEYYSINYAKADEIAHLITGSNQILSSRGKVSFDKRTNLLIIQDIPQKLIEIRDVITKLDSPVKQVLIEAKIVRASANFRKELGIKWGISAKRSSDNYQIGLGEGMRTKKVSFDDKAIASKAEYPANNVHDTGFNIDLGLNDPSSVLGLALAKLPGQTLVHLELSALEAEGVLEAVSSPKLITANKVPARIEQGQEIPYQEATSSGATSVSFKKAVLSLVVTPQITADNKIIMDLNVTNDTPDLSNVESFGVPLINTQQVESQVLIDDNQTIVLGGIFAQATNNSVEKVPFLGNLPVVGQLFKKNISQADRTEFLIFITPKIVIEKA